ncbi:response regulator [Hymenobacter guriensis]|uniref:Response regulator n=1 Tax=Hymenobacter guriensis TaxID=2793065 RepID=A0ABS0L0Q3_9BACT|nr:response regulator [Hymenobacter guriensis]MBG8553560.1 response regulator [Hymenobacter guriensis]
MKVLRVEDEPQLTSFIKKGFEHEGYELTVAYDRRTGWSLYQQPYDSVVLDVHLPYRNGVELCRHIRAARRRVPVLMLTALDSLADKVASFEAGAGDYLAEPMPYRS